MKHKVVRKVSVNKKELVVESSLVMWQSLRGVFVVIFVLTLGMQFFLSQMVGFTMGSLLIILSIFLSMVVFSFLYTLGIKYKQMKKELQSRLKYLRAVRIPHKKHLLPKIVRKQPKLRVIDGTKFKKGLD